MTLIKKYDCNTPDWKEIINNLNYCCNNNLLAKKTDTGFYVAESILKLTKAQEVAKKLKAKSSHLYVNIFTKSKTFGSHIDSVNVAFWQIKGISRWIIDKKEFIVNEGDLIKVNAGVMHSVTPLTPRAGISFEI